MLQNVENNARAKFEEIWSTAPIAEAETFGGGGLLKASNPR